ncbi:hypothetical protein NNF59_001627 [Providencia stuartii]|uniref:hypothetical protein n=2 Tax=Providencia TaxID=586 RepID=UPI000EF88EBC|nr:hypothetical protein [Providencia stuartii]EMF0916644.1 hypothetical protein [Providencia stuartii]MTC20866.1 hypothetical protein [Providencia stuartii]
MGSSSEKNNSKAKTAPLFSLKISRSALLVNAFTKELSVKELYGIGDSPFGTEIVQYYSL